VDTPENQGARARVGEVLRDKWTLDALIGVGGMAAVYAATHRNGRRGAVKLLHAELSRNKDVRQRFLREARVANKVAHPGAVEVLDDDVADDGSVFLVMELLEGESLNDVLERSPAMALDAATTIGIGVQLCEVLAAAHRAGIVHRDIKPDNLFLTKSGQLKVLDFGIARFRELTGPAGQNTTYGSATQTGSVMGTPAFMPPEQALGEWSKVDARSDLWAAGATLYTMLSGQLPHEDETVAKVLLRAMTKPVPSLATVAPKVPPALAALVDRALAREREDRFQSADEMRDALLAVDAAASAAEPFDPLAATTLDPESLVSPPSYAQPAPGVAPTVGPSYPGIAAASAGPSYPGVAVPAALVASAATTAGTLASASPAVATLAGTIHDPSLPPHLGPPRVGSVSTLAASSRSGFQPAPPARSRVATVIVPVVLALGVVAAAAVWIGRSQDPSIGAEPPSEASAAPTDEPEPVASQAPATETSATATVSASADPATSTSAAPIVSKPPLPRQPPAAPGPRPPEPAPLPTPKPGPVDIFKGMGKPN
jgi:serine/threonine-protein kinase